MQEALRGKLLAMSDLAAIVASRVDWGVRPQGDPYPGVSLHLITGIVDMKLAAPGVWRDCRVQADSWAMTFKQAGAIADLIERAAPAGLHGLRETIGGIKLRTFAIDRASDTAETPAGVVHRTRLDLNVWWVRVP